MPRKRNLVKSGISDIFFGVVLQQHQTDALEQAYDLLREHFDSSLIVVTTVVQQGEEENEATQIFWAGGYMAAVGQADYARYKIRRMRDKREESPEDQE